MGCWFGAKIIHSVVAVYLIFQCDFSNWEYGLISLPGVTSDVTGPGSLHPLRYMYAIKIFLVRKICNGRFNGVFIYKPSNFHHPAETRVWGYIVGHKRDWKSFTSRVPSQCIQMYKTAQIYNSIGVMPRWTVNSNSGMILQLLCGDWYIS